MPAPPPPVPRKRPPIGFLQNFGVNLGDDAGIRCDCQCAGERRQPEHLQKINAQNSL